MRQREILQLIAEGQTTKDIAQRLNLSVKTVETHRSQLMERLEIHDVPGLVRLASRVGLVQPYS
jgi:DNA-binding NarL/FixJ family response regulator